MNVIFKRKLHATYIAAVFIFFLSFCLTACSSGTNTMSDSEEFVWYNGKRAITYSLPEHVSPVVHVALDLFLTICNRLQTCFPKKPLLMPT